MASVKCQTLLGSCDFDKYPINGCEDEYGSDCDSSTSQCKCKPDNWYVVDRKFCFPTQCPRGQYYDHQLKTCQPQRVGSVNSQLNYCRYDFHCKGEHIHCLHVNEWNYRCVCSRGFEYDSSSQECHQIRGLNGFCSRDEDCDKNQMRQLVCAEKSCQCALGFTYNHEIDGCESNERIKERDSQTRKIMYLFIGLGLFFGAALSLKFSSNSSSATQHQLLKTVIERRRQQAEDAQRERLR
ncbi:unnamed protein product, partial [Oppiella nova]